MHISLKLNMHDNIKFRYFPAVIVTLLHWNVILKNMPQILYTEEANKKWYISYKGGNIIQYRTYNSDSIILRCTN